MTHYERMLARMRMRQIQSEHERYMMVALMDRKIGMHDPFQWARAGAAWREIVSRLGGLG